MSASEIFTFWDFAGQDAYQVAHSLFFSPRTMFFVFIDIEAFTLAFLQASIMTNFRKQETQLMDEFIERTVMHWIRMIMARQPDAEFVYIATKEDSLTGNKVTGRLLKDALKTKLLEVEATVVKMRRKMPREKVSEKYALAVQNSTQSSDANVEPRKPNVVFVSCTSPIAVHVASALLRELITTSRRGFKRPDTYSQVLESIVRMRKAAMTHDISARITGTFVRVDTLPGSLNIKPMLCHLILETLHDLGDVLWYEDLGVELFQDTVILDPLLLIDFIRQVINHKHNGQTMPHTDVKALPFWSGLNRTQMEEMKQVLQKFYLVFSANSNRRMDWDSDLIVPAYWQTKTPAAWLFLGDILRINDTKSLGGEAVRVLGVSLRVWSAISTL